MRGYPHQREAAGARVNMGGTGPAGGGNPREEGLSAFAAEGRRGVCAAPPPSKRSGPFPWRTHRPFATTRVREPGLDRVTGHIRAAGFSRSHAGEEEGRAWTPPGTRVSSAGESIPTSSAVHPRGVSPSSLMKRLPGRLSEAAAAAGREGVRVRTGRHQFRSMFSVLAQRRTSTADAAGVKPASNSGDAPRRKTPV